MGMLAICSGDYVRGRALLEETIDLCEKVGDRVIIALSLHDLAWGALLQGDYARARLLYIETLQLLPHLGGWVQLAEYLIGVGQLMAAQGDFGRFARLLGAALGTVPDIYKSLAPAFRSETEKYIQLARSALGEETFAAAQEAGGQLTLHEAAAWALKELQNGPA